MKNKNNDEIVSLEINLKPGHKCIAKLDVILILDNNLQSSRKIGIVQGDNGSYGFFVWIENWNIEAITPIDPQFNYQLVMLDPFLLNSSTNENENDLCLLIQYGRESDNQQVFKELDSSLKIKYTNSLKDEILAEYDPLTNQTTTEDLSFSQSNFKINDKSLFDDPKQKYRFILFYNKMTEHFISILQHLITVSHRIFTESIDFEWIMQYSTITNNNISSRNRLKNASTIDTTKTNAINKKPVYSPLIMENNSISFEEKNQQKLQDHQNISLPSLPNQKNIDNIVNNNVDCNTREKHIINNDDNELFFVEDRFSDDSLNYINDFYQLQIQTATEERKNEYVHYENYSLFVGTWNVNGQIMAQPELFRSHFLAVDLSAPDFYAIGFQELDLSKEAFLFNDNKKEDYWIQLCKQSLHPDRNYVLLKKIRLIGMMLIIFVAEKFQSFIKNVAAEVVGTGILGKMGNKGGVAIRFDLHDTSICFVNCHLAAHVEQVKRRNLDFREINSRLLFYQMKPFPKRICDHDQIYWFGDLNYRLIPTVDQIIVKSLLDAKKFHNLLSFDQLHQQMKARNCFQGYAEGPICHMPSYKYNPGTNQWDSSEKQRAPAWCDRILWRGENIKQIFYRSHQDLKDSDHKPVSALFNSQVLVIDHYKKRKVYEDVMKKLDKVENELLPQVLIDTTEINFETVSFKDNICRSLNLTNIGQSRIKYRFINKPNDTDFCKSWLRVTPSTGTIQVKEQITILFELNFDDPSIAYKFNYGIEKLSDTLVLSLIAGKDIFITISGNYKLSCFGCSLETLVYLERPISSMSVKEFQECFEFNSIKTKSNYKERLIEIINDASLTTNEDEKKMKSLNEKKLPLPRELYVLIDHLYRHGNININIFQTSGMENEFFIIRDALDSCCPNKMDEVSEHSIAEALLLFLETLPEPVIPYNFFNRISRLTKMPNECKQIYNELPEIHRRVFQYLMLFLQEMSNLSGPDKILNRLYIAKLFGPILVRKPNLPYQNSQLESNSLFSSLTSQQTSNNSLFHATDSSLSTSNVSFNSPDDSLTPEQFFINFFLNTDCW